MSTFRHSDREIARSIDKVCHGVQHPNGSVAHADWASGQTLHMAVMYSNPLRWKSRLRLFNDFRRYVSTLPNIRLYVCEITYGDRPFEATSAANPDDVQLRSRTLAWHKENALNLAVWRFPKTWEFGCWCDADVMFSRHDIGLETIHQLQIFDWVQMFRTQTDLGPNHEILATRDGMAYRYVTGLYKQTVDRSPDDSEYWQKGAPGFCWAFRREAFEACGSLMDRCPLGSADLHMSMGIIGYDDLTYDTREGSAAYKHYIKTWQKRAYRAVGGNVGFVDAHIQHAHHGLRSTRGYNWRWQILRDYDFNPYEDLYPDDEGLFLLTPEKPRMRDAIRAYLSSRNEDDVRVK